MLLKEPVAVLYLHPLSNKEVRICVHGTKKQQSLCAVGGVYLTNSLRSHKLYKILYLGVYRHSWHILKLFLADALLRTLLRTYGATQNLNQTWKDTPPPDAVSISFSALSTLRLAIWPLLPAFSRQVIASIKACQLCGHIRSKAHSKYLKWWAFCLHARTQPRAL